MGKKINDTYSFIDLYEGDKIIITKISDNLPDNLKLELNTIYTLERVDFEFRHDEFIDVFFIFKEFPSLLFNKDFYEMEIVYDFMGENI